MSVFKFESLALLPEENIESEALGIVAEYIADAPGRQSLSKEFLLSVDHDSVTVESLRSDGRMVFARLRFDGESFSLVSQGLK